MYELGYLLLPSLTDDALNDAVTAIKGILKKSGAQELDSENPVKIDLAYTMSKTVGARKYVLDDAFIGWVKFEAQSDAVQEINDAVKKMDEVIRFLVVKTTRETHFTFAEAMKKIEEEEQRRQEAILAAEGGREEGDKAGSEASAPVVE